MSIYSSQQLSYPGLSFSSMEWDGEESPASSPGIGIFPPTFSGNTGQQCLAQARMAGVEAALMSSGTHRIDPTFSHALNRSNHHTAFDQNPLSSSSQYRNLCSRGQGILPSRHRSARGGTLPAITQFENALGNLYQHPSPISDYDGAPMKLEDEDDFAHLHHPTPSYLPPDSFLLSPISTQGNFFPTTNSHPTTHSDHHSLKMSNSIGHADDELTDDDDQRSFLSQLQTPDLAPSSSRAGDDNYMHLGPRHDLEDGEVETVAAQDDPQRRELSPEHDSSAVADLDHDKTAPYAVLIHRALMSTPSRRMVLSQIYEYFREKIPRFRKVKGRGWMNSIRHNLSMNGAFLKEDRPPEDPGKGYIWVLSREAELEGVKSTTRYRKSPPNSKKRPADDYYLRGSVMKRRRKSTRKWIASKSSRSHSLSRSGSPDATEEHYLGRRGSQRENEYQQESFVGSPSLHDGFFKREEPEEPPIRIHIHNEHPGLDTLYATDEHMLLAQATQSTPSVDYSNCYSSFPHLASSQTLYNSEDEVLGSLDGDRWQFCGSGGDHFSEEFTLVTQK